MTLWLAAAGGLGLVIYAQIAFGKYEKTWASVITRAWLIGLSSSVGAVASVALGAGLFSDWAIFIIGFSSVHIPAACILAIKDLRLQWT